MRSKFIVLIILVGNLICQLYACAGDNQSFEVNNNATIVSVASQNEITRLVLQNDLLESVYSIQGELQYTVDENNLYIRVGYATKPINFFIKTKFGRVYKLILQVKDIPAVQIFIKNKTGLKRAKKTSYSEEYLFRKEISKLIKVALSEDSAHLGYITKSRYKKVRSGNFLRTAISSTQKNELIAEKIVIHNISHVDMALNRSDFVNSDTVAVYLSSLSLGPGEYAYLIRVARV